MPEHFLGGRKILVLDTFLRAYYMNDSIPKQQNKPASWEMLSQHLHRETVTVYRTSRKRQLCLYSTWPIFDYWQFKYLGLSKTYNQLHSLLVNMFLVKFLIFVTTGEVIFTQKWRYFISRVRNMEYSVDSIQKYFHFKYSNAKKIEKQET